MATKLVDVGCDWITVTAAPDHRREDIVWTWNSMLDEQQYPKSLAKKGFFEGYAGTRVEHGFMGDRQDGMCVILSGNLSKHYALDYLKLGMRPSRLDFQATGIPVMPVGHAMHNMFGQARLFKPKNGRRPKGKIYYDFDGPEGAYIGSRSSETFLRFYDKGKESRQKQWDGFLRCEIELKRETARAYASAWLNSPEENEFIAGAVKAAYKARGIALPFELGGTEVILRKSTEPTTIESKAAWITTQVSPTLRLLIEEVGWGKLTSMIFPDGVDKQLGGGTIE